jgi:hypothetical protein
MASSAKCKSGQDGDIAISKTGTTSRCSNLPVKRDLLDNCYSQVQTLRQCLLSKLPGSSRLRRKKIALLGQAQPCSESEAEVVKLLDTALVCTREQDAIANASDTRWQQWLSFSQKGDESYVTISDAQEAESSQSEVWSSK